MENKSAYTMYIEFMTKDGQYEEYRLKDEDLAKQLVDGSNLLMLEDSREGFKPYVLAIGSNSLFRMAGNILCAEAVETCWFKVEFSYGSTDTIPNKVKRLTLAEFEEQSGDSIGSVVVERSEHVYKEHEPVWAYVADDSPYVGVEYDDGMFSIAGLGHDSYVEKSAMLVMLCSGD